MTFAEIVRGALARMATDTPFAPSQYTLRRASSGRRSAWGPTVAPRRGLPQATPGTEQHIGPYRAAIEPWSARALDLPDERQRRFELGALQVRPR